MTDQGTKPISGGARQPPTRVTWSEELNKRVRTGDWSEQAVSTTSKISDAIAAGDWEVAAQLIDYWMEEAKVVYVVYQVWTEGWTSYLSSKGVSENEMHAELSRLRILLSFPDGTAFEPTSRWAALSRDAGSLAHQLRAYELTTESAQLQLENMRENWRQQHDRGADFQSGLLTYVATRFGEAAIGEAYAFVLEPYLEERYQPFDIRSRDYEETLFRNLYLSFEAMRGHLVGPVRTGDMELEELQDRFVISFDPCGSGNRGQRGDRVEGTPSRSDPPYNFGTTQDTHDWAWNEKGVCYYCAHCCFSLEYWPARQWGHPIRVIDSPLHPSETSGAEPKKCTWTIYKSLAAIPEQAYERIGMKKPSATTPLSTFNDRSEALDGSPSIGRSTEIT